MFLTADYKPDFDEFRDHLVELAQIRKVGELLDRVVTLLAQRPHVALARIWLLRPGDNCSGCHLLAHDSRERCLHRVASAGHRRSEERPDWSRMDGEYARIPLGTGKSAA